MNEKMKVSGRKWLLTAAYLLIGLILIGGPGVSTAHASTVYTFDVDLCTGGCLTQDGGTVTLTNELFTSGPSIGMPDGSVDVVLNLTDPLHNTNSFTSFVFNLIGDPTITVSNLSSDFALVSSNAGSIHNDGAGFFEYGIDQVSGGSTYTTLTFTLSGIGLTEDSFAKTSVSGQGSTPYYFAAPVTNGTCTGVIASDGGTTFTQLASDGTCTATSTATSTPEPNALVLIAPGLALVGFSGWKRRKGSH